MQKIIPQKLQKGDKVMVVAPSRGLKLINEETRQIALERFHKMGLEVVFAPNTTDEYFNEVGSAPAEIRAADVMTAFSDKTVKAVFTVIGGFNVNQVIPLLDYDLIRQNPKIICGFSDITALLNAITARTGLEVYYGPHFSSLGMKKGCEYTLKYLEKMLFSDEPVQLAATDEWSDDAWFINQDERTFIKNDGWWQIHGGSASGRISGGNLCTFNLLLGTGFRPVFEPDTILFLEDDEGSNRYTFDRNLQALCYQPDFKNVKGLVIGRFQKKSEIDRSTLEYIVNNKPELRDLPVIGNVEFGHTTPIITIPLGGKAALNNGKITLEK